MVKIKYNPVLAFLMMTAMVLLTYGNTASAYSCNVTPAHVSGTITLRMSRYGQNYPLNRGDFRLKATQQFRVANCTGAAGSELASGSKLRLRGPQQLTQTTDSQGNEAWILPGSKDLPFLAVEVFANPVDSGYFTQEAPEISIDSNDVFEYYAAGNMIGSENAGLDLVSFSNWKLPAGDESGSVVYNVGQSVGQISVELINPKKILNYTPFYDAVILDSLTVNYTVSSCGINSKSSFVDFGDIYKIDIIHGNVATRPFAVTLICGDENSPPSPVNITFSATNGFNDTARGIVNTNIQGLGLQLSWKNSALPPLVLNQVNHSTLSGIGDYSVLAKPVTTLASHVLSAGKLDTSVTMNIEFQ